MGEVTTTIYPRWLISELKAERIKRVEAQLHGLPEDQRQSLLDEALLEAHRRGFAGVEAALIAFGAQVRLVLGPKWIVGQMELGRIIDEHLPPMAHEERQTLLDQSLLEAVNRKRLAAAKALVKLGAKASVRDTKGRNALGVAIHRWLDGRAHFNGEMVKVLTPATLDPNEVIAGAPLLAWDRIDAEWLLANGADPNALDDQGRPIVHYTANYQDKLAMLHQAGANVFAVDREGRTLLHSALARGEADSELLEFFLGLGLNREDPSWFLAANNCDHWDSRPHLQARLIDYGFPIPQSLPTEAFRLNEAAPGKIRERVAAEIEKSQLDQGTAEVADVRTGNCPRCGRPSHPGRCRL